MSTVLGYSFLTLDELVNIIAPFRPDTFIATVTSAVTVVRMLSVGPAPALAVKLQAKILVTFSRNLLCARMDIRS